MKYEITNTNFPFLRVTLDRGEFVEAQHDSFAFSNKKVDITGSARGGVMKSLTRSLFTSESFFMQKIQAMEDDTVAEFSANILGDIKDFQVDTSKDLYLMDGAYLAHIGNIELDNKIQKKLLKGFFTPGGFIILKASGNGNVFINSLGSIVEKEIKDGEEFIIDNQHVLAWEEGVDYALVKANSGSWQSIKSGEGLVATFKGNGKIYIQTHNAKSFAQMFIKYLPKAG